MPDQRVWLALTPEGRRAFDRHVAALREIVGDEDKHEASARARAGPAPSAAARTIVPGGHGLAMADAVTVPAGKPGSLS